MQPFRSRAHPPTPFLLGAHLQWINLGVHHRRTLHSTLGILCFSLRLIGSRRFGALTGLIYSFVVIACFLLVFDYDYPWDADHLELCYSSVVAVCVVFVRRMRRRFSHLSNFGQGVSKMRAKWQCTCACLQIDGFDKQLDRMLLDMASLVR